MQPRSRESSQPMDLTAEIEQLRRDSLAALYASHDYYANTQFAWRFVQQMVREGHRFEIQRRATSTVPAEHEVSGLAHVYVTQYLASATFQHFVSLFEDFTFDLMRAWLRAYPGSLSGNQLPFRVVLESADKEEVVRAVVDRELLGLAYQRVDNWFRYLEKLAQLGCPSQDQIERLAEVKASRDVLVHNKGIANAVYVDKSMGRARYGEGEKVELPEHYHRESWELIKQVVAELAEAALNKLRK